MMRPAKILVVDDQASNRRLVREVLSADGWRIDEAADGEEALRLVAADPPDLVMLDVLMPERDGYSVCREIKQNPKTRLIPVVMLTSLDQLPDKLKALELGVDDFLTKPFNIAELSIRVRSLLALKRYTDELEHAGRVLEGMALFVERRDAYTGHHGRRLGEYAARVGTLLGMPEEEIGALRLGGLFHDLGKIAVPDAILRKPGKLTPAEYEEIKTHPVVGDELCRPMRTMERVLPLIRHHHERLDGSGYPDGLRGSRIPLAVRVISVCDVYDALATRRPYKEALRPDACLRILREESDRGWWDREIVEALERILPGQEP